MYAFFNSVDAALDFLPAFARLLIYGLLFGTLSMLIYWKLSPQAKLAAIKDEISAAQRALRGYDGTDIKQMLLLCRSAITPAGKQLLLILGPTLLAAAPVVLAIAWLESDYVVQFPMPGELVSATIVRAAATADRTTLRWPTDAAPIELTDSQNHQPLLSLPLKRAVEKIYRPTAWRSLLAGHDRTELSPDASCNLVAFDLPTRELIHVGPAWCRSWELPFFTAMSLAAIGMKVTLKIR